MIIDAIAGNNFGDLVRHACAAGDPVDKALGGLQYSLQNLLRTASFPQNIYMNGALAARFLVGDLDLVNAATDGVSD